MQSVLFFAHEMSKNTIEVCAVTKNAFPRSDVWNESKVVPVFN